MKPLSYPAPSPLPPLAAWPSQGRESGRRSGSASWLEDGFAALRENFTPLLVPGLFGSGPIHWQSQWERAFGLPRLAQAEWAYPDHGDWEGALAKAVEAAERPVLLIAHSLGALLSANWLARGADAGKVAGAFLAAPADIRRTSRPEAARLASFPPLPEAPLPVPATLVASRDDPWLSWPRAAHFAHEWGAALVDAGKAGHLGCKDPLGLWEPGARALFDLAARCTERSPD